MPRTWTPEQKQAKSAAVTLYWKTYGHPMQGRKHDVSTRESMKKPKHKSKQRGTCISCGRALYSPESARRGMGAKCAGLI